MATPITSIQLKEQTPEQIQAEKIEELQQVIAEQQQALNKLVEITAGLDEAGVLDAAKAAIDAKDDLIQVAVTQMSREPILNLIKHLMGVADLVGSIDHDQSKKMIESIKSGLNEAQLGDGYNTELGIFDLLKALNDPNINRAVKFSLNFLRGMGKGLDES